MLRTSNCITNQQASCTLPIDKGKKRLFVFNSIRILKAAHYAFKKKVFEEKYYSFSKDVVLIDVSICLDNRIFSI